MKPRALFMCWLALASCHPQLPGTPGECTARERRCHPDNRAVQVCSGSGRWHVLGDMECSNGCGLNEEGRAVCLPADGGLR